MNHEGQGTLSGNSTPLPFSDGEHERARELYPLSYSQVNERHVSFDYIAKIWWIRNNPAKKQQAEDQSRASEVLEHLARRGFIKEHGEIINDYWTTKPWAGCALTADGWIHSVNNGVHHEVVQYEHGVHQLCRDAHRILEKPSRRRKAPPPEEKVEPTDAETARRRQSKRRRLAAVRWRRDNENVPRDLQYVGEMLYSVLTRILGTGAILENKRETEDKRNEALAALKVEWDRVQGTVQGIIQRQARFEYFQGVILGTALMIPFLVLVGWLAATQGGNQFDDPASFTAAIIGGAIGAAISIARRMTSTSKPLIIDFTAPKRQKIVLGMLRPVLGAVFAAIVYFAITGGFLAIDSKAGEDPSVKLAFFVVVGFAAGFSERIAKDVLETASMGMSSRTGATNGSGDQSGSSQLRSDQTPRSEASNHPEAS